MCLLFSSVLSDSLQPIECSLPGSSTHGIFQARILEWVAISFSRGSSEPRDRTQVFCFGRQILYHWMAREIPDLSILSPGMSCGHLLEKTRPGSKNTGCRGPEAGSGRAYLAAMRPCQAAGTRSAEALKQDQVWCVWQQEGHCGGK